MAYDRAASVAAARRIVHKTMRVNATYQDSLMAGPEAITVRWHNRLNLQGNLVEAGYADVIEGVNRVVFNREELAEKSVVLHSGGVITLTDAVNNGVVLVLDVKEPDTGPINFVWGVVKK